MCIVHYALLRSTTRSTGECGIHVAVQSPTYTLPIEVKFREQAQLERGGGLVEFCAAERIPNAFLVTKRDADFDEVSVAGLETRFLRIPAHVFCYVMGHAERQLWR